LVEAVCISLHHINWRVLHHSLKATQTHDELNFSCNPSSSTTLYHSLLKKKLIYYIVVIVEIELRFLKPIQ
jgi:hypothetical protein